VLVRPGAIFDVFPFPSDRDDGYWSVIADRIAGRSVSMIV
jgi:hypothetical protein